MAHPDDTFPASAVLRMGTAPEVRAASAVVADLYGRYRSDLCRYVARTFGRGPPEPEDVVHSAFAQYASLADPSVVGNPRAFLYRTVHNVAVDYFRREATSSRHDEEIVATQVPRTDELDGERVLLAQERCRILEESIRDMEKTRRELLIMNRIHELSFAEISRRTGISQTQVKRLVADAIVECNAALERAFCGDATL